MQRTKSHAIPEPEEQYQDQVEDLVEYNPDEPLDIKPKAEQVKQILQSIPAGM